MYKVIIELKKDISDGTLKELTEIINKAFDNRGGKVVGAETDSPYCFEFSGGEDMFGCMQLALVDLKRIKLFWDNVSVWEWIDEDDADECCNVITEFSIPIR